MNYLTVAGGSKAAFISILRNEIENYFDINLMQPCIYRHTKKRLNVIAIIDGQRKRRGKARQYFCYFLTLYGALTSVEVGSIMRMNPDSVRSTLRNFKFRTSEEENILSELSNRIAPRIIRSCTFVNNYYLKESEFS